MSKDEEELRKLSVELRYLEQTAEAVQSRLNMINAVITDLTYSRMTMEGMEKEREEAEILVPIGGNSYVKAKLGSIEKVIVGVGAGVSIEKTLPETKDIVKKRLEDLGKNRSSLQQQFTQIAQKMNEDRGRFEQLVSQMREGKNPENV